MLDFQKVDEIKRYEFSWHVFGYDCGPPKIRSPNFTVNFQVTEWYIELDLSNLQNIDSFITFRLQRVRDIGPNAVTFDVKINVKLCKNKDFSFEKSQTARVFSEKMENAWTFNIDIPCQKLELKDEDLTWLSPKDLEIKVEMKSSNKTDPVFPKKYWCDKSSLQGVVTSLKKLYEGGMFHDLVLKVSGEEFRLHKGILNARWPKLMSTINIAESSGEVETKEFSGIPPNILKLLLKFAYCGDYEFMFHLEGNEDSFAIFNSVKKYNFYRLNDKITHLAPTCRSCQMLQSYRTSFEMQFKNVTSKSEAMGDIRTCDIPLKPRVLPKSSEPMDEQKIEKFQRHIKFLNIRLYVKKGLFGYNWLMFSITLGKIPQNNPVSIRCKLYVIGQSEKNYLLTEETLVFDRSTEVSFVTPLSEGKICKRYIRISEPVITWKELTDESKDFMKKREVSCISGKTVVKREEKDIFFRLELKISDGEYEYDIRHGEYEVKDFVADYKIFKDLEMVFSNEKFSNILLTSGDRSVRANKAILAARSEVLGAVLREKPNLKLLAINIQPDYLQHFVHYLYTGQIYCFPSDKQDDLLSAANEYKMECLKAILCRAEDNMVTEIIA